MRKHMIQNAAFEVAAQVRAVEDSVDAALAEIAELQARILRANSLAGVGFAAVHPSSSSLRPPSAASSPPAARGRILH